MEIEGRVTCRFVASGHEFVCPLGIGRVQAFELPALIIVDVEIATPPAIADESESVLHFHSS